MEITKDLFMKLANKFFADPSKGRVFREYCEDVGIRMDMTVEEMKTKIRSYHKQKLLGQIRLSTLLRMLDYLKLKKQSKLLKKKDLMQFKSMAIKQ